MIANDDSLRIDQLEQMKNLLVSYATGDGGDNAEYIRLRKTLLGDPVIAERLPRFVRNCRNISEFWAFIKAEFGTYAKRRTFLRDAFNPLILTLETRTAFPSDQPCNAIGNHPTREHVHEQWEKALSRRELDPAGAITVARSLLESVCKSVLHEARVPYDEAWDLPKLYKETAELLNLAPSQHSEPQFKKILGGCHAVVEGLGAIRNRDGDAHGPAPLRVKPALRHAQLAVNLAFATATFLIETWEERCSQSSEPVGITRN